MSLQDAAAQGRVYTGGEGESDEKVDASAGHGRGGGARGSGRRK